MFGSFQEFVLQAGKGRVQSEGDNTEGSSFTPTPLPNPRRVTQTTKPNISFSAAAQSGNEHQPICFRVFVAPSVLPTFVPMLWLPYLGPNARSVFSSRLLDGLSPH